MINTRASMISTRASMISTRVSIPPVLCCVADSAEDWETGRQGH